MTWTSPQDLLAQVERQWSRGRILSARHSGEPLFPLTLRLKRPSPGEMAARFDEVRAWIRSLDDGSRACRGFGYDISWEEVNHRQLGRNRMPAAVVVPTESDALRLIGRDGDGERFTALADQARAAFPRLVDWIARRPLALVEHSDDWPRILAVLAWFVDNPRSGLYVRQLDIAGVDTKFIEQHTGLIAGLLDIVLDGQLPPPPISGLSFEQRYGLRPRPQLVRFRSLDARRAIAGLTDITTPVTQFATLQLPLRRVFITENEINGLAFPDVPDSIVIFKLGYAIDILAAVPWLTTCEIHYWGDIDTHGFAILDRLRAVCPGARSLLMDLATLRAHQPLWGREDVPAHAQLTRLTVDERALYDHLRAGTFGDRIRLEQERVPLTVLDSAMKNLPPAQ